MDTVKLSLNICFNLFLLVSYTDEERGEREENEGEGGEIEEEEEGKKKKKKKTDSLEGRASGFDFAKHIQFFKIRRRVVRLYT